MAHGHFERAHHTAAIYGNLAVVVHCSVHNHLNTVHVGAKNTHKYTSGRLLHNVLEALFDSALRWSAAQSLNGGRFAEQRQHALVP